MTIGTIHLGQDLAGFGLVQLPWAGLSGLAARSLDRGGTWRQRPDRSSCRWRGPVGEDDEQHEGGSPDPFEAVTATDSHREGPGRWQ
jgi:hypothetical protein